ncbi:MAG: Holliday junction resolvase RuvX [Oscillospiraceae bacterium]
MKILGIDFGDSRTGFAVSDDMMFAAKTLEPLKEKNPQKVVEYAIELAQNTGVTEIVVGYPKNMNGTLGERANKTRKFAKLLRALIDVPVILVDERLTTVSAHNLMNTTNVRGKKRKESVDSISAAFILQTYMDSKQQKPLT